MLEGSKKGLSPEEISLMKYYRGDNFVSVWIGSGDSGWFYVYGTSIKKFKEVNRNASDNFNEAYEEVQKSFGNINEIKEIKTNISEVSRTLLDGCKVILTKSNKMKKSKYSTRALGLFPHEIKLSKVYKDKKGYAIIIAAGDIGWHVVHGIDEMLTEYREDAPLSNFNKALEITTKKYGELVEMDAYEMSTQSLPIKKI